jgi:hypothetical protein
MDLGKMPSNGVRPLDLSIWECHHTTILSAHPWPDSVPVPTFGPRQAEPGGTTGARD